MKKIKLIQLMMLISIIIQKNFPKLRLNNFKLITKIKLPQNYKSYKNLNNYFKNIISRDLKNLSKKKIFTYSSSRSL